MVRFPAGQEISHLQNVLPLLGPTYPPVQWVPGTFPSGVKRPGHYVDHSPPSSAKVKNEWSHTSTSPRAFLAFAGTLP